MNEAKKLIRSITINEIGYKSLKNFVWENIPDFAVITGLNGSGKTHLLEAINGKSTGGNGGISKLIKVEEYRVIGYENDITAKVYFINASYEPDLERYAAMVSAQVNIPENYQTKAKSLGNQLVENDEDLNSTIITRLNSWCQNYIEDKERTEKVFTGKNYENVTKKLREISILEMSKEFSLSREDIISKFEHVRSSNIGKSEGYLIIKCILEFLDYATQKVAITKNRYGSELKLEDILSKLIVSFHKCQKDLKRKISEYFENQKTTADEDYKLKKEIEKFFSQKKDPCDIINEILAECRGNYRNSFDLKYDISYDIQKAIERSEATIELVDIKNNEKRQFSHLSSGEKVIISLLVKFFTIPKIEGVDVIIVDEFDAHLNPQMASMYLNVMFNFFCKKYGKQVILTTHNPSTVAYTPEKNLFWMSNGCLNIKNKNEILKELTPGLILLEDNASLIGNLAHHINEKKYILFVEGESDQIYLTKAIEILLPERKNDIFVFGCSGVDTIKTFIEIAKQILGRNDCTKFIALVDDDVAGRNSEKDIAQKGCNLIKIQIAESHKSYAQLFLERKINYPIEFLFEEEFFVNASLSELGKEIFKEPNNTNSEFLLKLKGENQVQLDNLKRIQTEASFLIYYLKADGDQSGSKIKIANHLSDKANTNQNIFDNFLPTINSIKNFLIH